MIPFGNAVGSYETPAGRAGWLGRHFPSFFYYLIRMAPIVIKASGQARKGLYSREEWQRSSLAIISALEAAGVRFRVSGLNHIRALNSPCVIIANHMSTLETFSLPAMLLPHLPITFVVKKSLVEYPVFRHVMTAANPIVVERANPRRDLQMVMGEGVQRLAGNISVVVFPQTTRSAGFDPAQFNTIGVKLAKRAGVPVVPLALKTDAWGNGRLIKDFGRINPDRTVHFAFGPPLEIGGRGQEEQEAVIAFIGRHLAEWQE